MGRSNPSQHVKEFGGRTRPIPVRPLRQTIPLERFQPASSQTPVTQVAGDCMRRRTSSWRVGVAIRDVMGGFTPIRVRP